MTDQFEKQGYLLEDFRLFHLKSAAGVQTEYHYHEFCKLLLLVSGSGGYWVAGQRYALQPGDIILVGNNVVHRPEFEAGVPYERIIVYISPDFLRRSSTPDCDLLDCFAAGPVLRSEKSRLGLFQLAGQLEQELSGTEQGRVILSNSHLLRLLVEILREQSRSTAPEPAKIAPTDRRVQQILSYIDAHLEEDLTVESIAEQFYLSKFHMMRLFRSGTGSSILGYITHRRLMAARELINSGMAATESCFRVGFGSYSSFTRSYGKYFGTTPTGRPYAAQMRPAGDE